MPTQPDNSDTEARHQRAMYIRSLSCRDQGIREDAEAHLLRESKEAIPQILEEFEKEHKTYLSRDRRFHSMGELMHIVGVGGFCILITGYLLVGKKPPLPFLAPLIITVTSAGIAFKTFVKRTPKQLSAIYNLLLKIDKPQTVAVILEMYSADTIWLSLEAQQLLTRYLPFMTLEQWKNLTPQQCKALYRLLEQKAQISASSSYQLALAGVQTLMQFGDAEAIPTVEYIAKHGSNEKLRNMAYDCLEYLEIRREEDSTRSTLLRASHNSGGKDELLRIPTYAPDTESEQLLRMPRDP